MTYLGNLITVLVLGGGGLMAAAPTADYWRASEPPQRPAVSQPEPTAGAVRIPTSDPKQPEGPLRTRGARIVAGSATWYKYVVGGAAAGPALRKALGGNWRGTVVTVCSDATDVCVPAALTDACWCPKGNRVIDLDSRLFKALAPLGVGVLRVTVYR
jgi:hypothetical protein